MGGIGLTSGLCPPIPWVVRVNPLVSGQGSLQTNKKNGVTDSAKQDKVCLIHPNVDCIVLRLTLNL